MVTVYQEIVIVFLGLFVNNILSQCYNTLISQGKLSHESDVMEQI